MLFAQRFPCLFLHTYQHVWKIAPLTLLLPVSSHSVCCAIQTVWFAVQDIGGNFLSDEGSLMRIPWGRKCAPWDIDDHEAGKVQWQSELFSLVLKNGHLGLWSPAAYGKVMIKLSEWQMALDVLVVPLLSVALTIPNWLATRPGWRCSTEWWLFAEWNVFPQHCERFVEARQWLVPAGSPTYHGMCGQWTKPVHQQELPKSSSASIGKFKYRRVDTHLFKLFCWSSCRV